jgi:hypothetical protein
LLARGIVELCMKDFADALTYDVLNNRHIVEIASSHVVVDGVAGR